MSFKPGQSGNPGGRSKEHPFRDALRMEIAAAQRDGDLSWLRKIAVALLAKAADGDVVAIREVADRLDGKPVQSVEIGEPGAFEEMNADQLRGYVAAEAAELGLSHLAPKGPKGKGASNGSGRAH